MNVHVVSHTHWDREWYLTHEQFRLRLVALVDRLLDLMERRPDYRFFHLDGQAILLEDYLELRPHQESRLRRLIEQGRVLVGPWYVLPDEFLVSGEALLRNLALGNRVTRRFGGAMPLGYLPDTCGHVAQMPQILRQFDVDSAMLWRGFGGRQAEYWWEAPDGSRVLMLHLPPEGHCNGPRVHPSSELMVERAIEAVKREASRTAVGEVLLMQGGDHVEPHPKIPELTHSLSLTLGGAVCQSTLPSYAAAVRSAVDELPRSRLDVIKGELRGGEDYANLFPGVLSARMHIKQANARVQTLLEKRAEPLASFAWILGARYPAEELHHAWKTLMQNHTHTSIGGCSIDAVGDENMVRFGRAAQVARGLVDAASQHIARAVPAAPDGALRLIALNTNAQLFNGIIEATFDLPYAPDEPKPHVDLEALDPPVRFWPVDAPVAAVASHDGQRVPFQVLGEEYVTWVVMSRHQGPLGLRARRIRLAWHGQVPPCGYSSFDVTIGPAVSDAAVLPKARAGERAAENVFVRLSINDDGTVDVVDRRTGTRYARCGELEDVGDVGDTYTYAPPAADRRITSADASDVHISRLHAGAVRSAFRIDLSLPLPVSASPDRAARSTERVETPITILVTLDADAPRIGWHVIVHNRSRDHRLRLLFPVGVDSISEVRAETAFGVSRRPARRLEPGEICREVPASYAPTISFTEAGGARAGAVVFGEGLTEYEVTQSDVGAARLGLTLLRCVGFLSRDDLMTRPSGHAGPGLPTPAAQGMGMHECRLAFEPRAEAPAASALFARAASFVAPPHVVSVVTLPAEAGRHKSGEGPEEPLSAIETFMRLDPVRGAVVLSACHRAESRETLVVRVFNPDDSPAIVRIGTRCPVFRAFRLDFLETRLEELTVRSGAVEITVGPHRIATIEVAWRDSDSNSSF